jgi:hypothetical protein
VEVGEKFKPLGLCASAANGKSEIIIWPLRPRFNAVESRISNIAPALRHE